VSGLSPISGSERLKARRWDAIILGSGISALVAAARLGVAGQHVLVVEEARAKQLFPGLREPFFLAGAREGGIVDRCVRELKIPLIDQRRIVAERLAYQIVSPSYRFDVGTPEVTSHELSSWRLCDEERATALVRALHEASEAERKAMLDAPLVRAGRRLGIVRAAPQGSHIRGLPAEAAEAPPALRPLFDAQVTALSNLGAAEPSPEGRARLLGAALSGGAGFGDGPPWLHALLRRRVESVYGEFRAIEQKFDMVTVDNQPGIAIENSREILIGRALLIAAPGGSIARMLTGEAPDFLDVKRPYRRRLALHLRLPAELLPRGMAPRVVLLDKPGEGGRDARVITLTAFDSAEARGHVELIARMRIDEHEAADPAEAEIVRRVVALMPFSDGHLEVRPQRRPLWDDDERLEDPPSGGGWPVEIDLKVSPRSPVYRLDRAEVASLGLEGDLLLGWRAGDLVAQELA
jgi:hypothetical protein